MMPSPESKTNLITARDRGHVNRVLVCIIYSSAAYSSSWLCVLTLRGHAILGAEALMQYCVDQNASVLYLSTV